MLKIKRYVFPSTQIIWKWNAQHVKSCGKRSHFPFWCLSYSLSTSSYLNSQRVGNSMYVSHVNHGRVRCLAWEIDGGNKNKNANKNDNVNKNKNKNANGNCNENQKGGRERKSKFGRGEGEDVGQEEDEEKVEEENKKAW